MKVTHTKIDYGIATRPYDYALITCSDKLMSEILAVLPGICVNSNPGVHYDRMQNLRKNNPNAELYRARSGARLFVTSTRSGFLLTCSDHLGGDGRQAVAELRLGYLLRQAKKQSDLMLGDSFTRLPEVRLAFIWPRDSENRFRF